MTILGDAWMEAAREARAKWLAEYSQPTEAGLRLSGTMAALEEVLSEPARSKADAAIADYASRSPENRARVEKHYADGAALVARLSEKR